MIRFKVRRACRGNNLHIPCSGAYLDLELSEGAPDLFVGSQRLPSAPSADSEPWWKTAAHTSPLELSELLRDSVEEALSYFSADAKRLGTVDVSFSDHGRSVGIRIPHAEPNLALEIAHWAVMRLCSALGHGGDVTPIPPTASAIRELVAALNSSPTLDAIALAARQRHIHVARFDRWPFAPSDGEQAPEAHRGVMVLGQGNRQKRITPQGLMPVAEETRRLLQDRIAFLEALDQAQIPTAKRDTEFKNIGTLSRTLRSAARIGYPVFIKPRFKSLEQADIGCSFKSSDDLITSYERIFGAGRKVVVEAMLAGDTYRILVIAGAAVSVRKLARQLSNNSSQCQATCTELLNVLHPSIGAMALHAARCMGMSLAELIVVTSEISRPLAETGGGFVSIRMPVDISAYRDSDESLPMRMATKVLAHLCPPPSSFRIPIIAITGTNGKTTTSRIVSRILEVAGYRVGLACTDGVYINQELRQSGVMSGVAGTLLTLQYKEIDLAVLEISRGGLVSRGLAFDQCEAAACTNVADDHIGFEGIDTLDQMAVLKRLVVESARRWIVLNARDPRCLSMANRHDDRTICLVARDFREAEILTYLRDGYVLVGLRSDGPNKILCCWQNDRVIDFGDITTFPITFDGIAEHNVDNILHAVGLALAMGVDDELITRALRGIIPGLSETPARLNIYNRLPFTVIIDFAHNAHGLIALGGFIEKLDRHRDRNRIAVFPSRTRWSESQIVEASRVIASTFDYVVCRDPKHLRNCKPGEPSQNLANALLSVGMVEDHVSVIPDRVAAIKCALSLARSGDIVVCFSCYDHEEIWDQLDEYQQSMAADTA